MQASTRAHVAISAFFHVAHVSIDAWQASIARARLMSRRTWRTSNAETDTCASHEPSHVAHVGSVTDTCAAHEPAHVAHVEGVTDTCAAHVSVARKRLCVPVTFFPAQALTHHCSPAARWASCWCDIDPHPIIMFAGVSPTLLLLRWGGCQTCVRS